MARNASMAVEGDEIVIRIPATEKHVIDAPFSESGKSKILAKSDRFEKLEGLVHGTAINVKLMVLSMAPKAGRA